MAIIVIVFDVKGVLFEYGSCVWIMCMDHVHGSCDVDDVKRCLSPNCSVH